MPCERPILPTRHGSSSIGISFAFLGVECDSPTLRPGLRGIALSKDWSRTKGRTLIQLRYVWPHIVVDNRLLVDGCHISRVVIKCFCHFRQLIKILINRPSFRYCGRRIEADSKAAKSDRRRLRSCVRLSAVMIGSRVFHRQTPPGVTRTYMDNALCAQTERILMLIERPTN